MGYTHYLDKQIPALNQEQRDIANRLYRALLATIPSLEHPSLTLLDIAHAQGAKMPRISAGGVEYDVGQLFDAYFHEFAWLPNTNEPALFPDAGAHHYASGYEFIKTDRKLYDIAVWMTLQAVEYATGVAFGTDSAMHRTTDGYTYSVNEMHITHDYDIAAMRVLQEAAMLNIRAVGTVLPGLPLPDPADIVDDETRIGHLTIYGKVNVGDLRHIADMIEKGEIFSPADGSYQGQPSWVFTKS